MNHKAAAIERNPRQRFFYVALPEALKNRFTAMAKQYDGAQEVDHITLAYCPKSSDALAPDDVAKIVSVQGAVAKNQAPIFAKVQGWAYFDGAMKDGKDVTALVGLVDAPGLEDLHVALKQALKEVDIPVSDAHSFTPHFTFAYLSKGQRVDDLPLLDASFTIEKICFVNREIHEAKLTGSLGAQAVKTASHAEERAAARSKIDPAFLRDLEAFLRDKKLPRIPLHMAAPDGSTIALSPAGKRHVVSTVLAPGMKPKGVPLSSVLHRVKPPTPRFRKEATDFPALWAASRLVQKPGG